jgi:hypothetical protein
VLPGTFEFSEVNAKSLLGTKKMAGWVGGGGRKAEIILILKQS